METNHFLSKESHFSQNYQTISTQQQMMPSYIHELSSLMLYESQEKNMKRERNKMDLLVPPSTNKELYTSNSLMLNSSSVKCNQQSFLENFQNKIEIKNDKLNRYMGLKSQVSTSNVTAINQDRNSTLDDKNKTRQDSLSGYEHVSNSKMLDQNFINDDFCNFGDEIDESGQAINVISSYNNSATHLQDNNYFTGATNPHTDDHIRDLYMISDSKEGQIVKPHSSYKVKKPVIQHQFEE